MTERNGVCVALYREDRILVVRTSRYPQVWQPIGGGIEDGEMPEDAAMREVEEETGWVLRKDDITLHLELPMDAHPGTLTFFTATAPPGPPALDAQEIIDFRWVSPREACKLEAFPAARRFFEALAA